MGNSAAHTHKVKVLTENDLFNGLCTLTLIIRTPLFVSSKGNELLGEI